MRCKCGSDYFVELHFKDEGVEPNESINEVQKYNKIQKLECAKCKSKYIKMLSVSMKRKD